MGRLFDFMLPEAKSPTAYQTDSLFHFINEVSLVLLIGITAAMIYFAIKYRRRSEDDVTPVIHHNNALEITWSVIPTLLVIGVFGWGYSGWLNLTTPPEDAYEIKVTGQKWSWTFEYETGAVSANELHVPKDRPVKLVMTSRDILHSFYVPDYRVKHDVVPGRYSTVWFNALEAGESQIFCTEYCGTSHSDMLAKVIVHEQEDFDTWLATAVVPGAGQTPAEYGESLVSLNACITCHSVDGSEKIGPTFKGLFGREEQLTDGSTVTVDENYIKTSILNPGAQIVQGYDNVMSNYTGVLDDEQIDAIIEYIKTLE
jgi:cytochrome c oxidase subunit 2